MDFPSRPELRDAGADAKVGDLPRDAGSRDAGPTTDARPAGSCEPTSNARCGQGQLCCDRQDGDGPSCIDTGASSDCSACGVACDDSAPNCAGRVCECEAGSGKACAAGQTCTGTGAASKCVQCSDDADCAERTDMQHQCVDNKCVECDRGSMTGDSSDDEGCPASLPICNAMNQCTGCTVSPSNCPTGMSCNPDLGCLGCRLSVPISQNGCGGTKPVCTMLSSGEAQCAGCQADADCSGGFCFQMTGECVNGCDPDRLPGANSCAAVSPICKANDTGFACTVCTTQAECSRVTATPHCAIVGTPRGQCVQCRNNTDCSADGTGTTPVCSTTGATAGTCRPRGNNDCSGTTPILGPNGTCVQCATMADCKSAAAPFCTATNTCGQCLDNTACASTPATPVCNLTTNKCAAGCTTDMQCAANAAAPHCDVSKGVCVGCSTSADCTDPAASVCSPTSRMCVACNTESTMGDTLCAAKNPALPICVMTATDPTVGTCAACEARGMTNPGCSGAVAYCDSATKVCVSCVNSSATSAPDNGCTAGSPAMPGASQCLKVNAPTTVYGCYACDPSPVLTPATNGCPTPATCSASNQCVPIVTLPDGGLGL